MDATCHGSEDNEDNDALVGDFEERSEPGKRESIDHQRPDQLAKHEGKENKASEAAEQVEGGTESDIVVSGKEQEAPDGNPKDAKYVAERGVENGGGDIAIGGGRKGNGTGYGGREEREVEKPLSQLRVTEDEKERAGGSDEERAQEEDGGLDKGEESPVPDPGDEAGGGECQSLNEENDDNAS